MTAIALIGYGEVGRILAEDLRTAGQQVVAFDVKLDGDEGAAMREHAARFGVTLAEHHVAAARRANLVVAAVTAAQTVAAAGAVAPGLQAAAPYLDVNSASPDAKIAAARIVEDAGGRYVEAAVMTPLAPYRIAVPMLLGGPHASALAPVLNGLDFAATIASDELGVASATKMCRSLVVKGLEALVVEGFTASRYYGVEDAVIASLGETFPGVDWEKQGTYFFQRVIEHGRRRADELREVARTVLETGLEPWVASSAAERQASVADLADAGTFGAKGTNDFAHSGDWRTEADRMLDRNTTP